MPNKSASKFTNMIPRHLPQEESPIPAGQIDSPPSPKARGRRAGRIAKYNNDDYRQTNFYVHVDTFADAQARLRKERSGKDLSDLINELVGKWLKEPTS